MIKISGSHYNKNSWYLSFLRYTICILIIRFANCQKKNGIPFTYQCLKPKFDDTCLRPTKINESEMEIHSTIYIYNCKDSVQNFYIKSAAQIVII